jgi:hypothetical protein
MCGIVRKYPGRHGPSRTRRTSTSTFNGGAQVRASNPKTTTMRGSLVSLRTLGATSGTGCTGRSIAARALNFVNSHPPTGCIALTTTPLFTESRSQVLTGSVSLPSNDHRQLSLPGSSAPTGHANDLSVDGGRQRLRGL